MRYSYDWGVYEIQDEKVVSSFFLPGRPYNVHKEPTRYRVLAQYRPAGDEPFCLAYVTVHVIPGRDRVTAKEKEIVARFVRTELLKNLDIPVAFF